MYDGDGTMKIRVRIPSIHGPYKQQSTKEPYTRDADLPWYDALITSNYPNEGDVVALEPLTKSPNSQFIVIGMTGGNFHNGSRI